ncbi:MAG TPA: NAD(P)H-dependent oxidoreductase [Polyangiaceae bacterium]|nr:NAD(P)H-dependent oxidoreductase [Polyangiaceae bacterium]
MKAVVLSVSPNDRPSALEAQGSLDGALERAGFDERRSFDVGAMTLGFCQGEFDCWLRTPGRCKILDAEQEILASIPAADALVLCGPAAFGGFSWSLKRAIDRLIGLISPFFERRAELTHHRPRYQRYPRLFSVGVGRDISPPERATFDALNDANALNLLAPARSAALLDEAERELWPEQLRGALERQLPAGAGILDRAELRQDLYSAALPDPGFPVRRIRRAALLIGSAKAKGTSASEQLARALARGLAEQGVTCELHFVTEFVHAERGAEAAAQISRADLFVLASPLYVDAFPALATRALELVAEARASQGQDAAFLPLVNCGFPEPEHTRTALRIARHFARSARYDFAGALPLGGGGIITPDRSLAEATPPVSHVVRALALTAPALATGQPVPKAAFNAITSPALPETLYRVMGNWGMRYVAYRNRVAQRELSATPFSSRR